MIRELRFQRISPFATLPSRAHADDAGLDLYAAEDAVITPGEVTTVDTGVAVEIPEGYVGLVHPRSGLAAKHGITVVNAPGTIDAAYRGNVKVILTSLYDNHTIRIGDRIAQLLVQEVALPTPVFTGTLSDSDRGSNGFGSTGYGIMDRDKEGVR